MSHFCNFYTLNILQLPVESTTTPTTTTVLWPLYRSTCVSRHLQLRTGGYLLVQSFTVCMPLLIATSTFGLGRRRWSSQQCYVHCLCSYLCGCINETCKPSSLCCVTCFCLRLNSSNHRYDVAAASFSSPCIY